MEQVLIQKQEFTVTKEKIIKTHDLLVLYNERTEKLAKATQSFRALKLKNESLSSDISRLTEDNERLLETIGHLKPAVDVKLKELQDLQSEYSKLEKLYQQHLLDSQSTISQLQTKSKQCSCDSKPSLSPSTRRKTADDKIRHLKQVCSDLQSIESKLKTENRNLLKRNEVLEGKCLNAEGSSGGLKKELETVKHKLKTAETSLQKQVDLQQSLDSVKKKHEEEIALLNKKISYLTLDSNKLKKIETECELLRKQLAKYQKSKQHQQTQTVTEFKLVQQDVSTQTDPTIEQDDHFESGFEPIETECPVIEDEACLNDIFKDTILPWMMLSPLRCSPKPIASPTPLLEDIVPLPNIIITPPTPGIDVTTTNNNFTICKPAKQPLPRKRKKFWMPFAFNTLVKRRRKPVTAKQPKETDVILKALQTLQHNKIAFTISNQSVVEPPREVYTSQSVCWNQSCISVKRNAMLLKGTLLDDDNAELLGFYTIKGDTKTESKCVVSFPNTGLKDILQELLTGIKEISTNSNCDKLTCSKRRRSSKRRDVKVSEFNSTTESELERLFRKSSDVLVRNRRLLAAAKEQSSNYESLSEVDSDLMVDSGLVTATPVNDSDSIFSCTTISEGFKGFSKHDVTKSTLFLHTAQRCQTQLEKGYETPVCPVLISPLASSTKSTPPKKNCTPPYYAGNFKIPPTPCSDIEYCPTSLAVAGQKLDFQTDLNLSICTEDLNHCSLSDLHISDLDLSVRDPKRKSEENINDKPCKTPRYEHKQYQLDSVNGGARKKVLSKEYISSSSDSDSDQPVKPPKLKTPPRKNIKVTNQEKTDNPKIKRQKVKSKLKTPPRRSLRLSTGNETDLKPNQTLPLRQPLTSDKRLSISEGLQERLTALFSDSEDKVQLNDRVPPPPTKSKIPKTSIPSRKNICDNSSCGTTVELKNPTCKKINIVQDILITNNKAIDLLAGRGDVKFSLPRKKPPLQSEGNTPVDILSQVMQDMTKTGPAQRPQPKRIVPQPQPVFQHTQPKLEEKRDLEDCPKSPDIFEEPEETPPPKLIPEDRPIALLPDEMALLFRNLMVFANDEKKVDEIAFQLAFQDINRVAWAIVAKLQEDVTSKADTTTLFSPPLTQTQRILIGFLVKLDKSTHPGIIKIFQRAVQRVLYDPVLTCKLPIVQPLTRVHTALFKMKNDLDGIRRFVCECFYFSRDFAIPILFTVLTIWPNVLPKGAQLSDVPLAKLIVHLTYLKFCNKPGYNLMPLRDLFTNYYGYPTERWNCDEIFEELLVDYIRNPAIKSAEFGLLLFLKNKPAKWVNQKVKESLLPLYQRVPDTNPHLKATLLLLYASIHRYFSRKDPEESAYIDEMSSWFNSLQSVEMHQDVKDALKVSLSRLPRRTKLAKKGNKSQQDSTSVVTQISSANVSNLSNSIKLHNQSSNEENANNSDNNVSELRTEDSSEFTSD